MQTLTYTHKTTSGNKTITGVPHTTDLGTGEPLFSVSTAQRIHDLVAAMPDDVYTIDYGPLPITRKAVGALAVAVLQAAAKMAGPDADWDQEKELAALLELTATWVSAKARLKAQIEADRA